MGEEGLKWERRIRPTDQPLSLKHLGPHSKVPANHHPCLCRPRIHLRPARSLENLPLPLFGHVMPRGLTLTPFWGGQATQDRAMRTSYHPDLSHWLEDRCSGLNCVPLPR